MLKTVQPIIPVVDSRRCPLRKTVRIPTPVKTRLLRVARKPKMKGPRLLPTGCPSSSRKPKRRQRMGKGDRR
jgi:hypothetical protein